MTTIEADSHSIRRIGSPQYAVSTGQNSKLLYKSRQTTVSLPSLLDNHYCKKEDGNYGPKFTEAYRASHINYTIPRKEKDPGSFTLPCFINNTCFDNALVDLGASISVMLLLTYLNLGLFELAHTRLIVELADRTVKYLKGIAKNVLVGALMNVPIFVRTFSIVTDFTVLEDMDAYHDEEMGDVIVGEPFLTEVGIKAKLFEGIIKLYKSNDEVTYQMVRSYPRFKSHTIKQCNRIPPLLKVSEKDENNGISHAYQNLKGFYKGALNLGPVTFKMRRWKNGSYAGTLVCMRWNKEKLKKSLT
ncbi:ATP-dependent DNA helicase PIF1-like protein [Tanacetum coccineum]